MDKESLGCCNMIIWDLLLIVVLFTFGGFLPFHPVFKVTLGILCAFLVFVLMNIPILGIILQLFCCYVWYVVFSELLPIDSWASGDKAALWFCRIVLFILIFLLHFASIAAMRSTMEMDPINSWRRNKNLNNQSDDEGATYNYYEYNFYRDHNESNSNNSNTRQETYENAGEKNNHSNSRNSGQYNQTGKPEDNISHPFHGCCDLESLKNRYKKLARAYHPDELGGSAETFKYIQNEYDRLLKKYQ